MQHASQRSLSSFKVAYLVFVAGFFLWFLVPRRQLLMQAAGQAGRGYLAAAVVCSLLALLCAALNWRYMQHGVTPEPPGAISPLRWCRIFIYSYLGRYVPGKVTLIIGRFLALEPYGYSKRGVVIGAVYEYVLMAANATMIGFLAFSAAPFVSLLQNRLWVGALVGCAVAPLLFILSPWFSATMALMLRLLRRQDDTVPVMPRTRGLIAFLLCSLPTLANSLCFYLLAVSLHPQFLTPDRFFLSLTAVNFAFVTSMVLAVFPAGLGVREGVIAGILSTALGAEQAAMLAITHRVVQALCELIFWLVVNLLRSRTGGVQRSRRAEH